MRSSRLTSVAAAIASLVLLAGCADTGDGDAADQSSASAPPDDAAVTSIAPNGSIEEIAVEMTTVTPPDEAGATATAEPTATATEVPTLTYGGEPFPEGDLPFAVSETEVQQLEAGEGEGATAEQEVELRYLVVNGTTGEEILSTFPNEQTVVMELANPALLPGFKEALTGAKPGQSLIVAMPPQDAFGTAGNPQLRVAPADTLVFYVEVVDVSTPLTQAEGEPVEPAEGLPTVEADGTSPAVITIPEGAEPPTELVSQVLIKGEGEPVAAGQTIKVHYTGVSWSDGEQFDSSLAEGGSPFSTAIGVGQVIPGWDEALVGQTVGSRMLLVIPPELAYGTVEGHQLQDETLVFVVDILGAN